jgi:hypothetical protein
MVSRVTARFGACVSTARAPHGTASRGPTPA